MNLSDEADDVILFIVDDYNVMGFLYNCFGILLRAYLSGLGYLQTRAAHFFKSFFNGVLFEMVMYGFRL